MHLIPTRVGQGMTVPSGEPMESTEFSHHVNSGPEHQMVGIGQYHVDSECLEVGAVERLDGTSGTHGHERRYRVRPPGGMNHSGSSRPIGGGHLHPDWRHRPSSTKATGVPLGPTRPNTMASPNERKRYPAARAAEYRSRHSDPQNASTISNRLDRGRWKLVTSTSTTRKVCLPWIYRSVRPESRPVEAADSRARTAVVPTATTRSALAHAAKVDAGTQYRSVWITCSAGVDAVIGRNVSSPIARSTETTVAPASRQAWSSSGVK